MGSAPVRRSSLGRLASSARRGAPVGPGTPGVYRVNRRTATESRRPPQARRPSGNLWTEGDQGWWWDAGLWLGGAATDLVGYPLTLPAGAFELDFLVLDPLDDPDNQNHAPHNVYFIYDDGAGGTTHSSNTFGGSTPSAGSHIWVYWFGANYDPALDVMPTMDPATLVPAVFGQFGTA